MNTHGRRASFWTRWPDEAVGPLWAGIHLHERAGVTTVIGVEIFTEEPADARASLGPRREDLQNEMVFTAPIHLRAEDIKAVTVSTILDRFRLSSPEAEDMAGPVGSREMRYTNDHWIRVAAFVRTQQALGEKRIAVVVAETWVVSRVTAKKWIARCREKGYLAPVVPRGSDALGALKRAAAGAGIEYVEGGDCPSDEVEEPEAP